MLCTYTLLRTMTWHMFLTMLLIFLDQLHNLCWTQDFMPVKPSDDIPTVYHAEMWEVSAIPKQDMGQRFNVRMQTWPWVWVYPLDTNSFWLDTT
jgi:hypothetical protein